MSPNSQITALSLTGCGKFLSSMPKSVRFRTLTKELNRLKKQFIPKIKPGHFYSPRQLALYHFSKDPIEIEDDKTL